MQKHLFHWPVPLPFAQPLIIWASVTRPLWWFLFGSLCEVQTSFASAFAVRAWGNWGFRWRMSSTRGAVTSLQALNWLLAFLVGTNTPRPPCRAGMASRSLSKSVIPCLPVTAGRNWCRIASSSGCKRRSVLGTVHMRNVHLFVRAWVKTAYDP